MAPSNNKMRLMDISEDTSIHSGPSMNDLSGGIVQYCSCSIPRSTYKLISIGIPSHTIDSVWNIVSQFKELNITNEMAFITWMNGTKGFDDLRFPFVKNPDRTIITTEASKFPLLWQTSIQSVASFKAMMSDKINLFQNISWKLTMK